MNVEQKTVNQDELVEDCRQLSATYDYLVFMTAVDYLEKNVIELVYYLQTLANRDTLILKVELPRQKPEVHSLALIWPAAEWHERETFDLFGVNFIGHPDQRRILLPEDWDGHPLLKDYSRAGVVKRPETIK